MALDLGSQTVDDDLIPGLQKLLIRKDFERAPDIINHLPKDSTLLEAQQKVCEHLPHLCLILRKFGVGELFGLHQPHTHYDDVLEDFQMAGRTETRDECLYYWTRAVDDTLESSKVCGLKYIFHREYGLCPYDFHEGDLPDTSKVDPKFFLTVEKYLVEHDLTSTFGLLYLAPGMLERNMLEFVLPNGDLLLVEEARIPLGKLPRVTTAWARLSSAEGQFERKLECVVFPDLSHRKVDVKPKKSYLGFDDVLHAFHKLSISTGFDGSSSRALPVSMS